MKTCPACWSIHIERSHRRSYERLLSLLGIYPFYCNECGRRFHARSAAIPSPATQRRPMETLSLAPGSAKLLTNDSHPRMAP